MIRFAIVLMLAAGVFSFLAFKDGGILPGIVFALVALSPIIAMVTSTVRNRHSNGQPAPWSSNAKAAMAVIGVVALAGVAYSGYWMFVAAKPAKDARYSSSFDQVCAKPPKYFPSAAKHEGPGPHPIVVFYDRGGDSSHHQQLRFDYRAGDLWTGEDVSKVQLVACYSNFDKGAQVGECKFDKGTAPLFTGTYQGGLYEARTHRKVRDISVPASPTADEQRDCPTLIYIKGEAKDQQFHTQPDPATVQQALAEFVTG